MVRPHRLVSDGSVLIDDVDHVRHGAVAAVHGPFQVVHEHRVFYPVLLSTLAGEFKFLIPAPVGAVMFARVRFANINGKELKILIPVAPVQFVQGRDLADKRRSGDTPEL